MPPPRWFLLVYAASGAAALIYEVAWTRLLTLYLGHGVAAASTVLAAFMGGLAIGAAVAGPLSDRLPRRSSMRALRGARDRDRRTRPAGALRPGGDDTAAQPAYGESGAGAAFPLLRLVASLVLIAVPAVAMGATFPLVARWYVPDAAAATRDAGALYAANTVGAALGALGAGFGLLPALGLRATTWAGVALNLAVAARGVGARSTAPSRRPRQRQPPTPPRRPRPEHGGARAPDRGDTGRPVDRRAAPSECRASSRWRCRSSGRGCWRRFSGRPPTRSAWSWPSSSPASRLAR